LESQSSVGEFVYKCADWFEKNYKCHKAFMTHSCTGALEMAALTIGIEPGDEVIVPSFTHISTANAFALRGAKIVFADVVASTMCIDPDDVSKKISHNTKAVVAMHYGGYAADIDRLSEICASNGIFLIEDAAHSIGGHKGEKFLGTFGDIGCISFHETKNIHCGEGGVFLLNNEKLRGKAEEVFEKGSNRAAFLRNEIQEYSWTGPGSSFGMNNISAAMLWSQLQELDQVNTKRRRIWEAYYSALNNQDISQKIHLPPKPDKGFNAHIFFIKCASAQVAGQLLKHLNNNGVAACRHFPPLHKSVFGKTFGPVDCKVAEEEYRKLIRLPLHLEIGKEDTEVIADLISKIFD